ncbi:hypothetical protein [Bradyrhizobium archetypum]|jgi:hypothetical protein|uniref:Uncharacterized protein n=1 Tax=Bradyrhizobium archetypum TaxID=2721160 RepID=A0A7Y4H245_9BRAD|nr:hypothetical protein [Bradyrhizobium archetypum]NOJ46250.1 hypothetical protein [Bradyrhizobium archetypum]
MASEEALDKPAANGREPTRNEHSEQSQPPQIQPPLLNEGPELERDSHC